MSCWILIHKFYSVPQEIMGKLSICWLSFNKYNTVVYYVVTCKLWSQNQIILDHKGM